MNNAGHWRCYDGERKVAGNMKTQESVFARGAKIVGIAGVAAGVAGALVGRVLQGKAEPSAQERVQAALQDLTAHERASLRASIAGTLASTAEAARSDFEASVKESRKRRKKAQKRKRGEDPLSLGDHLRLALADASERAGENLHQAIEHSTETAEEIAEAASRKNGKRFRKQARALQKELEASATEGRSGIMKLRKDARGKTEDRLHELEELAKETVGKHVKPSLEKAGVVAASGAAEARKRLEEEARDLERHYSKAKPQLEKRAEHYAELFDSLRSDLRHVAEERGPEVEKALQDLVRELSHTARDSADQAKHIASDAGESAARGGKNFGSLLLWLVIAGGVVYALLMNEEQKRKARELASSAYHEGKAIYQDVKGQDAEFTT